MSAAVHEHRTNFAPIEGRAWIDRAAIAVGNAVAEWGRTRAVHSQFEAQLSADRAYRQRHEAALRALTNRGASDH